MQNKVRKKHVLKWIKQQVEMLEPEEYMAIPKTFGVPPHLQFERKKIEPFWYNDPVMCPVNHKRRVWHIYKKEGLEGVNKYFRQRGFELNSTIPILVE